MLVKLLTHFLKLFKMALPKFYVGQRVVALVTAINLVKGKEYFIRNIIAHTCGNVVIDVGLADAGEIICSKCNRPVANYGIIWLDENLFAPIHENFQAITFEKIVEKELSSVN